MLLSASCQRLSYCSRGFPNKGLKQTENREALSDDSKIQKDELVVESSSSILCVFSPMGKEEDEVMTTLW